MEETKTITAKDRLKNYRDELVERNLKLGCLIGKIKSDNWEAHQKLLNSLSNEQKKLMKKQYKQEREVIHTLNRRLATWIEE